MMGQTERVILIKGDAKKWYNQAIFIVNKDTPAEQMPMDFVAEAEKIIHNYLHKEKKLAFAKEAVAAGNSYSANTPGPPLPKPITPAGKAAAPTASVGQKPKKRGSTFDFTLNIMMILACLAIFVVFLYGMLS